MTARWSIVLLSVSVFAGCGFGAEGNFTSGRDEDRCDGTFPVCQTAAGCTLGPGNYLAGQFPGTQLFVVPTPAEAIITVALFFRSQTSTGEIEVFWSEPGCFETHPSQLSGRDVFREAGNDQALEFSQQVLREGDHLVEVRSDDAVADYLLKVNVDVQTP